VSGVDVWLNNPQYPLEACGTSGMKAAINGIPNLSVLDGWWGEGYDGNNGWAIKPASDTLDEAAATTRRRARSTRSSRTA
jgi:starch phosphorylase